MWNISFQLFLLLQNQSITLSFLLHLLPCSFSSSISFFSCFSLSLKPLNIRKLACHPQLLYYSPFSKKKKVSIPNHNHGKVVMSLPHVSAAYSPLEAVPHSQIKCPAHPIQKGVYSISTPFFFIHK